MKLNITHIVSTACLFIASTNALALEERSQREWWSEMPECGLKCLFKAAERLNCDVGDVKCLCELGTLRRFQLVFEECLSSSASCLTRSDYTKALKVIYSVPCVVATIGPVPTATIGPVPL
ncbi:hypothetical protein CVT24_012168 [Panaeolus cyanescens]|uniref:CFEM domain-containing protein n=1 Tax=Panaeolus cyanescens TaxID=181874 RepID=A0A409YIX4_9AGAR|nr:hypothetical protein CVT24_012168 [Panaeolus cyanescens]